jgi:hypothetical protein
MLVVTMIEGWGSMWFCNETLNFCSLSNVCTFMIVIRYVILIIK